MTAITWEVTSCPAPPAVGFEQHLKALLSQGWEPFAATADGSYVTYHLRRQNGRRSD